MQQWHDVAISQWSQCKIQRRRGLPGLVRREKAQRECVRGDGEVVEEWWVGHCSCRIKGATAAKHPTG